MADQQQDGLPPVLTTPFQLADWQVHPALDRISRNGEEVRLEPRVMSVLTLLAARAGEVVSREELEAGAWGKMVVGYDALPSSINKLRKALGDDTQNPRYIETVSKKGYRLIASVGVLEGPESASQPAAGTRFLKQPLVYGIAALILATALVAYWFNKGRQSPVAQTNSTAEKRLVVLPFANIGNDPKQEYFVDGITDDLITDLSGLSGIVVISRTASYRYKGQEINPREVGEQLGADYLVEGSVRKSDKRWRINVKLIDTGDGASLWAKRYENTEASLFGVQDEVARKIVQALALQLNAQDKQRLSHRPTTNFEAYELFLLGQKLFKVRTKESNLAAQDAYRQAIQLDPNFARAYGALAVALDVYYWRGWSDTPTETLDRALAMARYATELDPGSPQAYWALGYTLLYRKEPHKAAAAVERAIELAPNYADGYGLLALIKNYLGEAEAAIKFANKGMKLNPHYSWDFPYNLGRAYYLLGRYPEAIEYLRSALDRNTNAASPRVYLAAAYAGAGRKEDAAWEIEQLRVMSPESTVRHWGENYPTADEKLQKRFLDHLRLAGLPE